jgi:dipeptidyl aminopeptidase/acylaminoacyl peptidase
MRIFLKFILIALVCLLVAACVSNSDPGSSSQEAVLLHNRSRVEESGILETPEITTTTFPKVIISSTPFHTNTAIINPTATPTIEKTATATPTLTHPLMVEVMRQQDFPGSDIVFEETLEDGANYDRHIVSYQSEGHKIYALLTVPYGQTPETGWPVIIFNHGYIPPEQYRTTERYVNYVDVLARNGYIIFRSDYRGHGFSEGEPKSSYQSPAYTVDILNAIASIKRYEKADSDRIGMWGHSMGGNITLRAMVVSEEIKAGVIWGGVVVSYPDMYEFWWGSENRNISTPDPNSRRGAWRREWVDVYGSFDENPRFWASITPNSYLSDLSGPVQLHHGTNDSSVPHVLSEILYEEVLAEGLPIELYLYEGDDHNLTYYFWTAMQRSVNFFDLHVKGNF